jgi:pyruvate formate lyase activating enzyme
MPHLDPSRREFLRLTLRLTVATAGAGVVLHGPWLREALASQPRTPLKTLLAHAPVARYWEAAPGGKVRCQLCANTCLIPAGDRGHCRARYNDGGVLKSLVWGRPISTHVDPIEKKPFYHVLPGATAYSLATSGCPLRCKFCQNWEISQAMPEDYAADIVAPAVVANAGANSGAPVVAFTYNEPTVFLEYMADICEVAKEEGLRCVLVSCGYMEPAPLREMCGLLDAIKIDLKGADPGFYREVCEAELAPVQRTIEAIAHAGVHLEIVNLVVPTLNDDEGQLDGLASWVASSVGVDVPLHFTRFHPDYQLRNLPATPVATLQRARELALGRGLRYVYTGNVPDDAGSQTTCPRCAAVVIARKGFFVENIRMKDGACAACGQAIPGVWK